ncbi:hypothetical protein [Microbacterium sp.]|uniref:hypothetical protein n=1 Tax=Microbacterium sp. TaxID=51671 RepID=UPI0039E2D881
MSLEELFGLPEPEEPEQPEEPEERRHTRRSREPREPKPAREPKPTREPKPPKPPRAARAPRAPGGSGRNPTVILGIIAGVLALAVAVVLVIALTRTPDTTGGDQSDPVVVPAPATSSATAVPSPSETAAEATITFSASGFTLRGSDGDTFTHAWADDAAPAIAALTAAFGAEPTTEVEAGNTDLYAYTCAHWDGFRFCDVLLGEGNKPREEVDAPTYAAFSANEVDGVQIEAEFGLRIGQTLAEVRALGPDDELSITPAEFLFGNDRNTFYVDGARTYGVRVETDGAKVTEIVYRYVPLGL